MTFKAKDQASSQHSATSFSKKELSPSNPIQTIKRTNTEEQKKMSKDIQELYTSLTSRIHPSSNDFETFYEKSESEESP